MHAGHVELKSSDESSIASAFIGIRCWLDTASKNVRTESFQRPPDILPLFSHGAEVFEQATLARLDLDLVRVSDLQTADGGLEAPAPDVVRVRVPDDADRRAHGVSPRLSTGLLSSPRFGWSESLWAWIRVADLCASTTVSGRACSCLSGSVSSRSSASPYPRPCIPKPRRPVTVSRRITSAISASGPRR